MRRAVPAAAAALLLAGPTVLAFFSGGYFTGPRLVAAIVAWSAVLALAATRPAPLPTSRAGRLALGGLVALTVWSALSIAWAPLGGPAVQSVQRLVLYVGTFLVALGVLRDRRAIRAVEPALAAGAAVVICYGLAGRLLPGIVELARSERAGGRLEQPLTYWNAEGTLAAIGLVLCARLAGDRSRPDWLRAAAAAATVSLGAGVYLSYSRGAIALAVLGLVTVIAFAPSRAQLRAGLVALASATAASVCVAAFPWVAALEGAAADRARDGAIALAVLVALAAAAALLIAHLAQARPGGARDDEAPGWILRLGPVAAVAVAGVTVGLALGGLGERPSAAELAAGAQPSRLTTASSNRYEYWRVGLEGFGDRPLRGTGAGGYRVLWLRERTIHDGALDAHSIEIELLAELGIVGLLAFGLAVLGVLMAARAALRGHRSAAAGACAALLVWFLHASIDWDWQMPAVTLPAIVLAALLIVLAESRPGVNGAGTR
jgi:hypothetical protein